MAQTSQTGTGRYYSGMLLRQHPWLKERLQGEEYPVAFSYRKPELAAGISLAFIGGFAILDALFHLPAFGIAWIGLLVMAGGAALLYGGVWALCFAGRAYLLVTSERVVYQKVDLLGRPGRQISIPRGEIRRVRFLKSTVMYRMGRSDGGIAMLLKNGRTVSVSNVRDAENIFGALR